MADSSCPVLEAVEIAVPLVDFVTSQTLTPRSNLAAVIQAQKVEIRNDWNGYSDITPIIRHYKLRLVTKDLVGNAHIDRKSVV